MEWTIYRDLFGGWRWECHDANGHATDSQYGYDTREECVEAAEIARLAFGDAAVRDAPDGRTAAQHAASPPKAILCVQPNQDYQQYLRQALGSFHTVFVSSASEALRCLNGSVFDAHILNYSLPDSSGVHLCREIRRIDPHAPICFYTAVGSEEQRSRAFKAGADGYVCSPCGPDVLLDELRILLDAADRQSMQAKFDEEHAIRNELKRRVVVAINQSDAGKQVADEATERAAKIAAGKAFIDAGGTRANFERWWGTTFASVSASHRLTESGPAAKAQR